MDHRRPRLSASGAVVGVGHRPLVRRSIPERKKPTWGGEAVVEHMNAAASARITAKLWQGTLPADDPVKMWGGDGSGLPCAGCDMVIPVNQLEHEAEMPDGRTLRFHVACAGLWRVKQALPKSLAVADVAWDTTAGRRRR
jgi:hypothetical protein